MSREAIDMVGPCIMQLVQQPAASRFARALNILAVHGSHICSITDGCPCNAVPPILLQLSHMLCVDANVRWQAVQLLDHAWFKVGCRSSACHLHSSACMPRGSTPPGHQIQLFSGAELGVKMHGV